MEGRYTALRCCQCGDPASMRCKCLQVEYCSKTCQVSLSHVRPLLLALHRAPVLQKKHWKKHKLDCSERVSSRSPENYLGNGLEVGSEASMEMENWAQQTVAEHGAAKLMSPETAPEECPICLESRCDSMMRLPCGHALCRTCLNRQVSDLDLHREHLREYGSTRSLDSCPICRAPITSSAHALCIAARCAMQSGHTAASSTGR